MYAKEKETIAHSEKHKWALAQLGVELAQNEVGNREVQVMEGLLHHHIIKFGI